MNRKREIITEKVEDGMMESRNCGNLEQGSPNLFNTVLGHPLNEKWKTNCRFSSPNGARLKSSRRWSDLAFEGSTQFVLF